MSSETIGQTGGGLVLNPSLNSVLNAKRLWQESGHQKGMLLA